MRNLFRSLQRGVAIALVFLMPGAALGSSHQDAPLISIDPPANTTDVYAFLSQKSDGQKYLTTAFAVYPFEEAGVGPNLYDFDPNVLYQIHVATGADVAAGRATYSYQYRFTTRYKNVNTGLQYLPPLPGAIQDVDDAHQNRTQTYTVTKVDNRTGAKTVLGTNLLVPPNNEGRTTPYYNKCDDGDKRAKDGITTEADLDRYTKQTVFNLNNDYRSFAGQRDDGFYADVHSIFDLDLTFSGPNKPFDSQGGFNVHTLALEIPVSDIGGTNQVVGVYVTTSRQSVSVLSPRIPNRIAAGRFVQVGRQGNPLFVEGLAVAIKDKDLYNQTPPTLDNTLFRQYAENPELAKLLQLTFGAGVIPDKLLTGRTDLAAIFIPDLIKVDLSTAPARLAGPPDDPGFHRLSVFGGDALTSTVQPGLPGFPPGTIPGGWPNGRRFGDDVLDIAVMAVASDLRTNPLQLCSFCNPGGNVDKVIHNDVGFIKVMPYEPTPQNGRNHSHEYQQTLTVGLCQ